MFTLDEKEDERKEGVMALKLDMTKAYDRIEWTFVESMLISMGFPHSLTQNYYAVYFHGLISDSHKWPA